MKEDWKNALSALRNSLDEPQEEIAEQKEETPEKSRPQSEPLTVVTDRKGRNGKVATIIEGFKIDQGEVESIARKLKQQLGVGGSVREGEILVQGDHKEKVKEFLSGLEFKIK